MLDLGSSDPARRSADRRVALVMGYALAGSVTFAAVGAGAGGWALAIGGVLALCGLPWLFVLNGRPRLLTDALAGVPFVWRGDRPGVWATAPIAGALGALLISAALGLPTFLALPASLAGAAAYAALFVRIETRYERAILLDLTVLELRFSRITDTRALMPPEPRLIAASSLKRT